MRQHPFVRTVCTATLAAALLAGAAFAAPVTTTVPPTAATAPQQKTLQPIRVYGSASVLGENRVLLENSNEKDPYQKISVTVSAETLILDAVTGAPKSFQALRKGETLYAYVGPTMGLSMPPVAHATLILCGIPADFSVPAWAEIQSVAPGTDGKADVQMSNDTLLQLGQDAALSAYGTDAALTPAALRPGMHLLTWCNLQAVPTKVLVFPAAPAPDAAITRLALLDALYAATDHAGETPAPNAPFTDVLPCASVNWAYANKLVLGDEHTQLLPHEALNREQLMLFLLRYATALDKGPVGSWAVRIPYADASALSPWAQQGAMWNVITKLVAPTEENQILPAATVTQDEAAAAIKNLLAR